MAKTTQKRPTAWLMKSEPESYSIDHLESDGKTRWEGVRNYQARNFMMNEMRIGDRVLFYHSSAEPPGAAGLAKISALAAPDLTAQDPASPYFDPKAAPDKPIWYCVELSFERKFKSLLPLSAIRREKSLQKMALLQRGQRLSIQPVTVSEFACLEKMAEKIGDV